MKTSSYVFSTLYKNILRIIHGIGTTKSSFQDYAMAKVYTNECYITNAPKVVPINSTKFVGIVGEDLTLSKYIGYFDNDDHAMQAGIPVGGDYYLSQTNTYGLPFGMRKKVSEPYAQE